MKLESVVYAVSGVFFGLIVGWIIGSQQTSVSSRAALPPPVETASQAPPPQAATPPGAPQPAMLDQTKVQALQAIVEKDPKNALARAQLGNVFYDAGRYPDAIKWYSEALALNPKDAEVSTDLGVSYYYNNDPDRAITQLERSLQLNPSHTKALLNLGVVKAFGKQDLKGATDAWKKLVEVAPQSPEGQQAKQALDSLSSAHGAQGQ
jgi:tetratricopeptide (TPR) repeat protein